MNPTGRERSTTVPFVVEIPADPTGPALADVVRRLRAATGHPELVVDLTRTRRSSPGVRRALLVLRSEAARRGCSWTFRGTLPAPGPRTPAGGPG
ncbi:hypothetical protein [Kineococcus rhizosphaerae]|uniref:STAS domain-containing protein n=1 Tax=Kineococcus rhizosphaerae TaxID=559628 RepID=A0A2T0R652_9ACTN|nr:hypothetical protein [Kineococcus rhizosphaerae]PRY16632.1 hypothetical protein CLV37_10363 [Kineococcus rhizosphaerae]